MYHSFYYACVPVTNVGNLPGNNLDIYAYIPEGTTDEITEDKPIGFKNVSLIPVKQVDGDGNAVTETVYAVVPLANYINAVTDFDKLGILHLKFKFELDGKESEETAVAEKQFLDNRRLVIENDLSEIKVGESLRIETTAYPWNELKELSYSVSSQDEQDCISVTSDGLVTGIKEGSALLYMVHQFPSF